MSSAPLTSKRLGFTLVELLVVVAIIALLLGILLPSLNRAREMAQTVVCSSQLRSLAMMNITYTNSNDDVFIKDTLPVNDPAHVNIRLDNFICEWRQEGVPDDGNEGWLWGGQFYHLGYMGNPDLVWCPVADQLFTSQKDEPADYDPREYPGNGWTWRWIPYGYNATYVGSSWGVVGQNYGAAAHMPAKNGQFKRPTETIMFGEEYTQLTSLMTGESRIKRTSWDLHFQQRIHERHNREPVPEDNAPTDDYEGASNISWVDGHVSTEDDAMNRFQPSSRADPDYFDSNYETYFDRE